MGETLEGIAHLLRDMRPRPVCAACLALMLRISLLDAQDGMRKLGGASDYDSATAQCCVCHRTTATIRMR